MAKKAKKAAKTSRRGKPVPKRVNAQPASFHTVTPQLIVRDAPRAIDFYKRAFGAREVMRMASPDGKIMHAELKIGDSIFFLVDESPEMGTRSPQSLGGHSASFHVYFPNVDAAFKRAVDAGAQSRMEVTDMFWGDRYGSVADPFGHEWGLATHKEDLTAAQHKKRAEEFFKHAGGQHG